MILSFLLQEDTARISGIKSKCIKCPMVLSRVAVLNGPDDS